MKTAAHMKKFLVQLTLIVLALAAAGFAAWKITTRPVAAAQAGEEEKKAAGGEHAEHQKEGHVEFTEEQRKNAALGIEAVGAAKIRTTLSVYGKVAANQEALAHVMPRFAGLVKEVRKRLGDQVERGEILAVVESNESLTPYNITSDVKGTVIQRDMTLGEFVNSDKMVFIVADLSAVWVDLSIFRQDFGLLRKGQPVEVHSGDHDNSNRGQPIKTQIDYISPFGAEGTQTMLARVVVPNVRGDLRPGLFATAEIITGEVDVPVTVKLSALQTFEGKTVVFVEEGDALEAREVQLGIRDGERVEVKEGLKPGEKYVAANSFVIKAELGKGEAEH